MKQPFAERERRRTEDQPKYCKVQELRLSVSACDSTGDVSAHREGEQGCYKPTKDRRRSAEQSSNPAGYLSVRGRYGTAVLSGVHVEVCGTVLRGPRLGVRLESGKYRRIDQKEIAMLLV